MIINRRNFIIGSAALVAAPAIIRVAKIMPIKVERTDQPHILVPNPGIFRVGDILTIPTAFPDVDGITRRLQQFVVTHIGPEPHHIALSPA